MITFGNILRKKTDQNAPFFKIFSKIHTTESLCHAIYTIMKKYICTPLLNFVMYAHLSLFERKQIYVINGPLFPILMNTALIVWIVLQKHYFHGICAFLKKTTGNFTRSCAFAQIA